MSLISSDHEEQNELTNNFLVEFFYFLPYIKKTIDVDSNNNIFGTSSGSFLANQELDDFEIDSRLSNTVDEKVLRVDARRLSQFVKSLLKQVEIDFLTGQQFEEPSFGNLIPALVVSEESECDQISDYVCLSECFSRSSTTDSEADGKIITTDITRIEVFKSDSQLLHTPPGIIQVFVSSSFFHFENIFFFSICIYMDKRN